MFRHPFLFLLGFAMGFLPVLYFLANSPSKAPEVLAEDDAEYALAIDSPEPEEITPTPTPTPTPTISPKPTATPTPEPTSTPDPTPTPVPTPTPDVWSPPDIEPWFSQYASEFGVDKNVLERLANCESHFNPNAVNGGYLGMFQFSAKTWSDYSVEMGLDPNPALRSNTEESIRTAAYVVQQRGVAPWPSCLR